MQQSATQPTQATKYNILKHLYRLPKGAKNKVVNQICDECLIGESTFHRWCGIPKFDYNQSIPHDALQVIAKYLKVDVQQLMN